MKKVIVLYKPVGMTPLEAINKFREINKNYAGKKMCYAGRLDPMAEGVLLVLVGEETKKIGQYLGFDKEYMTEILVGISTDSGDVLGIAHKGVLINNSKADKEEKIKQANKNQDYKNNKLRDADSERELIKKLKKIIKELKGKYEQKIPAFSSYKIKGRPMFYYARKQIPINDIKKVTDIKRIRINSIYKISSKRLLKYAVSKINKVQGDFRQEKIKEKWKELLGNSDEKFLIINTLINCSSGTYIRAIAEDIGKIFGGGLLLNLKRTKVGKFDVKDCLRV